MARHKGRAMRRCWRRVRDLNPGDAFGAYTISNRAPSATRTTLREMHRQLYRKRGRNQVPISSPSKNVADSFESVLSSHGEGRLNSP